MEERLVAAAKWLFESEVPTEKRPGHLWSRWIVLRALGLIYFSAFYSLLFQIKGLMGPGGILPTGKFLHAVTEAVHPWQWWYAPTLFWLGSSNHALMFVMWVGLIASVLAVLNLWPRASLLICFVCFLSFVTAAQDFSSYQSDGMLLEAGFIALFFVPRGLRPGLGRASAPSRFSRFLLQWEWFRIYFESAVAKWTSGDPSWHNFTAMDKYYENCPLPTWIGWYVQHLPHSFHAFAVGYTFAAEFFIVWLMFFPRRFRIACFFLVTPFQISIILTANYTFLNYIVLLLGILLLDDKFLEWVIPQRLRQLIDRTPAPAAVAAKGGFLAEWRTAMTALKPITAAFFLGWIFYATAAQLLRMLPGRVDLPSGPVTALEPFRIANSYGLFAVMTAARYEIEFEGSNDGKTWTAYPFRYKPQDLSTPPGIYAPYQPRFEWNLWFASLGTWREYHFVIWTQEALIEGRPDVLGLFKWNPFASGPPQQVRTVIYQYWFTDLETKRETGKWWRRELLGAYAPGLEREPGGRIGVLDLPVARRME